MRGVWSLLLCFVAIVLVVNSEDLAAEEDAEGEEPLQDEEPADGEESPPGMDEDGLPEPELTAEKVKAIHKMIDKNGDGKASLQELVDFDKQTRKEVAVKDAESHIEMSDANKDGKVSLEEQVLDTDAKDDDDPKEKMYRDLEIAKFKAADKNGDGFLTKEEIPYFSFPEVHDEFLDLVTSHSLKTKDKDSDGELTFDEMWLDEIMPEDGDKEDDETRNKMVDDYKKEFAKLDSDGNGKINLSELKRYESGEFHLRSGMEELFSIVDTDKDSHITADELVSKLQEVEMSEGGSSFQEWISHHEL